MRLWEKLVSVAAIAVIVAGSNYAYEREALRDSLDARFHQINKEYFDSQLSYVRVVWDYLPDAYGQSYSDGTIKIGTTTVTTGEKLEETLRHEACHQFVGVEHEHNEVWRSCMTRFSTESR